MRKKRLIERQFERLSEASKAGNRSELASLLGVDELQLADAFRRESIPDDWLITLMMEHDINPVWILTGQGKMSLSEAFPPFARNNTEDG